MQLFASRDGRKDWAKAIAMMRHGFGGHPYGPNESIQHERVTSRVGDIYRPSTTPE
jgi:6-phosphogluconate dehydrogenase